MGRKGSDKDDAQSTTHHLSICIQAQQFKPGISDINSDEEAFIIAKSSADKLSPEAKALLLRHLEQDLDGQFTRGMMNPSMPGRERFPSLFEWYLERCLNRYVNHVCEVVKEKEGVASTNLTLIADRQALTFILLLSAYALKKELIDKEVHHILILSYGLLPIFLRSHKGDKHAQKQIEAIQKLIYADQYGLQLGDIEQVLKRKHAFTAKLARGMEISQLLAEISWLVKRADGARYSPKNNDLVQLADDSDGHLLLKKDLVEKIRNALSYLQNPTLENLAIAIYNESIDDGSGGKDPRKLKADLRAYEKWLSNNLKNTPGHEYGCDLPAEQYTKGWRKRKPGSGGKRETKN